MKRLIWKIKRAERRLKRLDIADVIGYTACLMGFLSILIGFGSANDMNPFWTPIPFVIAGVILIAIGYPMVRWEDFE